MSSSLVRERSEEVEVYCKAWPVRNGSRFPKTAFALDWQRELLRCPNQQEMPFVPGGVVQFPAEICQACPLRERCTTSRNGRSVSIHPDEALLCELRERQRDSRWDEPSYVNGLLLNMLWRISDTGRDDVPAIEVSAKICLICAAALLFTICMSWLAHSSFNLLLDVDLELLGTGCLIVTSG